MSRLVVFALAMIFIAFSLVLSGETAESGKAPESMIRAALEKWTADFNAGRVEEICGLFASELIYDYRGQPERNYRDICSLLHRSLDDRRKQYRYALEIKEILVSGEFAVVRLVWTLTIRANDASGSAQSTEPGMDLFRKQPDGSWKIIRFIAYEQ
jgi:ketosteroid isomerase-like protein